MRYATLRFELIEELTRRAHTPRRNILNALPNSFVNISLSGDVEKMLIGVGVLNDGCLPFDREHHRAFGFLELLHEVAGTRRNVVSD
jgi:hypothetical protein